MLVPIANYPTSRDYRKLWDLTHQHSIVCIVDMERGEPDTPKDIAKTGHSPEWIPELVTAGSVEEFVAGCEACNLEWLVPTPFGTS